MSYVATTAGITGEDVRGTMVAAVEHRFGAVDQLPSVIEWVTDDGSCYVASDTLRFPREFGLIPKTTQLDSSRSDGLADAFAQTLKRDCVRVSVSLDAESVLRQASVWLVHDDDLRPYSAPGYLPRGGISRSTQETLPGL